MQVCIPGLHISLGIFHKLFNLLEDACHKLDVRVAVSDLTGEALVLASEKYKTFAKAILEIRKKQEEALMHEQAATTMEQLVTWLCLSGKESELTVLQQMKITITESRQKAEALVNQAIT